MFILLLASEQVFCSGLLMVLRTTITITTVMMTIFFTMIITVERVMICVVNMLADFISGEAILQTTHD
jgi:hypothetical protein